MAGAPVQETRNEQVHAPRCDSERRHRARRRGHGIVACPEVFRVVNTDQSRPQRKFGRNGPGPAISKDGLSLYFAAARVPGGFGGEDIYVSQRETRDAEWGPAINLGPTINTAASEMVPAFSRDGHLMFFASNRLGGLRSEEHTSELQSLA